MNGIMPSYAGLVVCLGVVVAPSLVQGQEAPLPKPTAEHERLAKNVGTWDGTIKSWNRGPDSEPTVSQGVEVVKLMPGGLWTQSEFDGKFGDHEFHGCGQSGYDTRKGKYVETWVDSMSTEIMMMEGDYDPASRTLTMYSKGTGPSGKAHDAKMTTRHEGDDIRVFTVSMKSDETKGEYVKLLEITYKRRAK
jgi:Protein of unknown function (DUF1579)